MCQPQPKKPTVRKKAKLAPPLLYFSINLLFLSLSCCLTQLLKREWEEEQEKGNMFLTDCYSCKLGVADIKYLMNLPFKGSSCYFACVRMHAHTVGDLLPAAPLALGLPPQLAPYLSAPHWILHLKSLSGEVSHESITSSVGLLFFPK